MKRYFDLMITRLQEQAKLGKSVGIVQWFNFTTFDIIGDLTFAQSFGCLDDSNYHPWISMLFVFIKAGVLGFMLGQIPWLQPVIKKVFVPKGILEKRHLHAQMTRERVQERLLQKTNHPDFVRYILDAKKDGIVWRRSRYTLCVLICLSLDRKQLPPSCLERHTCYYPTLRLQRHSLTKSVKPSSRTKI